MVLEKIEIQATFEDQVSTELQGVTKAFERMGQVTGAVTDEIQSRVDNAISTMVEFGATNEQVAKGFQLLNKAAKDNTKSVAQVSNVLRTMVDESENADFALRNVAKATTLAAQAGIKLEDAGRQLGQAFRGETAVLQNFDKAAKRAASAIDDITDPALRAKAIMIELNAATRRQNSVFAKLSNQFRLVGALAPNFTRGIKGLAAAFAGAGAAVTAFTAKSLKTYMEGSAKMRRANKRLEKSLKDLQFTFGALVAQAFGLGDGFKSANSEIVSLTKTLRENRVPIVKATRDIAHASIVAAQAITAPLKGLMLLFKFVQDGFTELTKGASFLLESSLKGMLALSSLKDMFGIERTKEQLENVQRVKTAIQVLQQTRAKVDPFKGTTAMVNDFNRVDEVLDKFKAILDRPVKDFKIEPRTTSGGKSPDDERVKEAIKRLNEGSMVAVEAAQAAASFAASQRELLFVVNQTNAAFDANMHKLDGIGEKIRAQIELQRKLNEGYRDAGNAVTDFANGAVKMATDSVSMFFEKLASGEGFIKNFGVFLLNAMGDLMGQMGQAFILLGAGFDEIKTGILSPGALIAIGVGMVALSGALKGFAARAEGAGGAGGGAGGGGTAAALERFGRRIFDRGDADQGREVTINIEGRSMRGFVLDVAADGARRGSVPLTPRRA